MSAGDTARSNYEAVRNEILQRMQLRDYVLLVFLGFTGAIFGVALGPSNRIEVLLALPFMGLGTAFLISQHNMMAAVLGQFLSEELDKTFKKLNEHAPQWENSKTFGAIHTLAARYRLCGHMLTIAIPCILALGVNFKSALYAPFPDGPIWWFGVLCLIISILVMVYSHSIRMEQYLTREWNK